MQKLREEMEKNQNNPYIQVVGQFLLTHLEHNPQDAEKIDNPDKTIAKSLDAMRKVAEKKKSGNYAVLTDQEGFKVVLDYFGIKDGEKVLAASQPIKTVVSSPSKPSADFDIKLEDLL